MNIEFEEWIWTQWNGDLSVVTLHGTMDFQPFCVGFGVAALSELFGVQRDSKMLREAFAENREFLEKIARVWIRAGRLEDDGNLFLAKEDLLPYFEKRAATAPA
ncbi:MAG TPA: hypothetical protein VGQ36_01335 [Thermoanaerobaculia bacterium]|jgi:hypothetical protein|nr:hypothetical protein [Thermoanaerobaculia bacterium]